jgi:hypothetical protein
MLYRRRTELLLKKAPESFMKLIKDDDNSHIKYFTECHKRHWYLSIVNEKILDYDITNDDMLEKVCKNLVADFYESRINLPREGLKGGAWSRSLLLFSTGLEEVPQELESIVADYSSLAESYEEILIDPISDPIEKSDYQYNVIVDAVNNIEDNSERLTFKAMCLEVLNFETFKRLKADLIDQLSGEQWWLNTSALDYLDHHQDIQKKVRANMTDDMRALYKAEDENKIRKDIIAENEQADELVKNHQPEEFEHVILRQLLNPSRAANALLKAVNNIAAIQKVLMDKH